MFIIPRTSTVLVPLRGATPLSTAVTDNFRDETATQLDLEEAEILAGAASDETPEAAAPWRGALFTFAPTPRSELLLISRSWR